MKLLSVSSPLLLTSLYLKKKSDFEKTRDKKRLSQIPNMTLNAPSLFIFLYWPLVTKQVQIQELVQFLATYFSQLHRE